MKVLKKAEVDSNVKNPEQGKKESGSKEDVKPKKNADVVYCLSNVSVYCHNLRIKRFFYRLMQHFIPKGHTGKMNHWTFLFDCICSEESLNIF